MDDAGPSESSILDAVKGHSLQTAKDLWAIIDRYRPRIDRTSASQSAKTLKRTSKSLVLLRLLAIIPYLLIGFFVYSLFWDFNGVQTEIWGHLFRFNGLMRILSISGLIGFFTNWIAITMLFKPSLKHPILGQGLVPAQKNRIAARLAQAVAEDLINPEIIKRKIRESNIISIYRRQSTAYIKSIIDDPSFRSELKQLIVGYVEDMIANPDIRGAIARKILQQIEKSLEQNSIEHIALRAYSLIKGHKMQLIIEESLNRIPESIDTGLAHFDGFLDDLPRRINNNSKIIEQWITSALYKLVNQLNVQTLVEDNLRQYDEQHLSDIILKATNEQLRYIQYLGGVLGVIGGLVIWEPIVSLVFLIIMAAFIFLIDFILLNLKQ